LTTWIRATGSQEDSVFHTDKKLTDEDRALIREKLEPQIKHAKILNAPITLMAIEDTIESIASKYSKWGKARERVDEISRTLKRELRLVTLLALNADEKKLFSSGSAPFGEL